MYMDLCICQNSSNVTLRLLYFIVCKFVPPKSPVSKYRTLVNARRAELSIYGRKYSDVGNLLLNALNKKG